MEGIITLDCVNDMHVFCNGDILASASAIKTQELKLAYTVSGIPVLYLSEAEIVKYNWIIGYIVLERPKYNYCPEVFSIESLMIVNLDA